MAGTTTEVYEGLIAPTLSDTTDDPSGPFAGLVCDVAGTLKITTVAGQTQALHVVAGQHLKVAVRRVWSTGTGATVLGLSHPPYKPPLNPGTGVVI